MTPAALPCPSPPSASKPPKRPKPICVNSSPNRSPPDASPPAASPCASPPKASSSRCTKPASSPPAQPKSAPPPSPCFRVLAMMLPRGPLRIEGHTDNVPIHTAQFATNWELSTARATAIARLLLDRGPIDPANLSAAGYAEYPPHRQQRHRRRPRPEPPRRHHSFATPSSFTMTRFFR